MVKLVNTADLKSAGASLVGSSPTADTKPPQNPHEAPSCPLLAPPVLPLAFLCFIPQ